ncbi:serine/threonine-protein kinase MARK2-like isoform X2 [Talpa occidentalis]|uniref:serine/threonine-protein kinase MARK2-like isoform X2 n=1 Tax=Talpa occidentalis TaxID=50954 RepID=UPI0023F9923C|nr:serine/threonine-protein kinase MARK2-like isoform X2 [Talpa occidentalis]
MPAVYSCTTGTKVAIKDICKSELPDLRLLTHEMGRMKALHHPNIFKLFQVVDTGEELQLVMESVDGGDLQDYLSKRGCLLKSEAHQIFQQILSALSYCHAKGIAHRDVKSESILLNQERKVKWRTSGSASRASTSS